MGTLVFESKTFDVVDLLQRLKIKLFTLLINDSNENSSKLDVEVIAEVDANTPLGCNA
ncbi:MAG: hypothetical protein MZV64_50875 [Ignavibacteriales bacterium]|nr:hypothetical protein [Ignavibacteriales bacterium]